MSHEPLSVDTKESIRKRRIVSIVSIAVLLVLFALISYFVGYPLVKEFQQSPDTFREYIKAQGLAGPLMMIGIVVMQVVVAIIPGEPFEVAAGFVFGWFEGMLLCLIGSAISGALIFLAVRKWGVKLVEAFFPPEKINQFSFLRNEKKLHLLVFILFLIPGTPKDLVNYLAGLTPIKLAHFVILSTLARIPSIVSSTVTGSLAQSENWLAAAITYGITAIISVVCILWYRKVSKEDQLATEKEIA